LVTAVVRVRVTVFAAAFTTAAVTTLGVAPTITVKAPGAAALTASSVPASV